MGWIPGKEKLTPRGWSLINPNSAENVVDKWLSDGPRTALQQTIKMAGLTGTPIHPKTLQAGLQEAMAWQKEQKSQSKVSSLP
jgi:hypothetical protein